MALGTLVVDRAEPLLEDVPVATGVVLVAVLLQDTAVGRLVTAFALQRLRAYCVAAC